MEHRLPRPRRRTRSPARRKQALLAAEQQLAFGPSLSEVIAARDELRLMEPDCLLLQLVEAKISRMVSDVFPDEPVGSVVDLPLEPAEPLGR